MIVYRVSIIFQIIKKMAYNLRHLCQDYTPVAFKTLSNIDLNQTPASKVQLYSPSQSNSIYKQFNLNDNLYEQTNHIFNLQNLSQQEIAYVTTYGSELRHKIHQQTKHSEMILQKLENQLEKVIGKIKVTGASMNQLHYKEKQLIQQHAYLHNSIAEAQHIKQRCQEEIDAENRKFRQIMNIKKRQECEISEKINERRYAHATAQSENLRMLEEEMQEECRIMEKILQQKLKRKNVLRDKLAEIKLQIESIRLSSLRDIYSFSQSVSISNITDKFKRQIEHLEQHLYTASTQYQLIQKNFKISSQRFSSSQDNFTLNYQELVKKVDQIKQKIKERHTAMTKINLDMQGKISKDTLLASCETPTLSSKINLLDFYLKHLEIFSQINHKYSCQIKSFYNENSSYGTSSVMDTNIHQITLALREEQKTTQLIKDQYQKLKFFLEERVRKQICANLH